MHSKTEINIKAAELLGYIVTYYHPVTILLTKEDDSYKTFDIFANTPQGAWYREQVIIALGEKHGIGIFPDVIYCDGSLKPTGKWLLQSCNVDIDICKTYPEAMVAAVKAAT